MTPAIIKAAVSDLDEPYRTVVEFYLKRDRTYQDLAEELGFDRSTIYLWQAKGLEMLRKQLEKNPIIQMKLIRLGID